MKKNTQPTAATLQNATQVENHKIFVANCHTYVAPKDLSDAQQDAHFSIRQFLRETAEAAGVKMKDATPEQFKLFIATVVVAVKAGTIGTKRLSITKNLEVCSWALSHELKVIAEADEITKGRAIEVYIITDFVGKANTEKKEVVTATKSVTIIPAGAGKGEKVSKPAKKEKAPAAPEKETSTPANVDIKANGCKNTIPAGFIARPDLLAQLEFEPFEKVEAVQNLFEAWNMGGEFYLLYKTRYTNKFDDPGQVKKDENRLGLCGEGKRICIGNMHEIGVWFTVIEKQ